MVGYCNSMPAPRYAWTMPLEERDEWRRTGVPKEVGLRAIEAWWRQRSDASPWEELLNPGSLDTRALYRFRSKIWPDHFVTCMSLSVLVKAG